VDIYKKIEEISKFEVANEEESTEEDS